MPGRHRTLTRAGLAAALFLAIAPASGGAAIMTYGSDLTAPADVSEARQADTIYFQSAFADGRPTLSPTTGQVKSVRIKGTARVDPAAGGPGGERDFHIQVLALLPDGRWQIRNPGGTSGNFQLPNALVDPQTVTEYFPENLCVYQGDAVVFNTVGGWSGPAGGPYPLGTPLQIFSRNANAIVSQYTAADMTNNGDYVTPTPLPGNELLMQVTVGNGADATGLCPGGGPPPPPAPPPAAPPPPPPPPSSPAPLQKATIGTQRVSVSRTGRLVVALYCRTGPRRCVGTIKVRSRARKPTQLGIGTFDIAAKKTGHATVKLNRTGRVRFAARGGRLPVTLVAETRPGGAARRSSLAVTLRRRGSA